MFALGPLSLTAPLALLGLLALPVLWLLLRATPPAPRQVVFPPLRLLLGAPDDAETPQKAPWWLLLFRLLIATLVILALARPVWTPTASEQETRPALLVIDNGWASAPFWADIEREAGRLIDAADRDGRPVGIMATAPTGLAEPVVRLSTADDARRRLNSIEPQAWPTRRASAATRLEEARASGQLASPLAITWLSDGLDAPGTRDLASALAELGPVNVVEPDAGRLPAALLPPSIEADGLAVRAVRVPSDLPREIELTAIGNDGRAIARDSFSFAAGADEAAVTLSLPLDLRNRITRLRLEGLSSAGAVRLLGDQWRRPRVGVIQRPSEGGQVLLSDTHYLTSALQPYAQMVEGSLDTLLEDDIAVLVMTDETRADDDRVADFVAAGGVLIRFAGPRLAARGDSLLPVALREGGRLFGGALNWDEPQSIADFPDNSPFAGLPTDRSATIQRQVLAQPGSATPDRVWARLQDGTPLVTAERRARGWIVLFHVTASPDWSDLPLTGLFPRMMQRLMGLAQGGPAAAPSGGAWVLDQALGADGRLGETPAPSRPVAAEAFETARPQPDSPPGLYRLGSASAALNIMQPSDRLAALPRDLPGARYAGWDGARPVPLDAILLALALGLLTVDVLLGLILAGRLPVVLPRGTALALLFAMMALPIIPPAEAQPSPPPDGPVGQRTLDAALNLRFAYVTTGNAGIDGRSEAGLAGLSREITRRSAIEPQPPMAVNVEEDELIFYPLIYWPVQRDARPLSAEAAARVRAYLQTGGLILLDTQDADVAMLRAGTPHPGLVTILESIDVPPLAQIPSDHVLTRAFYLLQEFPGRFTGSPVWVEANPSGASRDGTSGVIIGAHDWASAWAEGANGGPVVALAGGPRQREMSLRFGVNIAMYALTGNYKADQVHVPDILERLGQ
ncbi:DUF4159 domain-containing protein [Maricaulis sp. CAU 1757]